ncbi:MAG TPA: hypothetical protein VJV04_12830 [Nitrospiraceae bacterium]|nr:hypothetical protein [Nitrospiraceae bacterium]
MRFQSLWIGVWIALVVLMTMWRQPVIAQQQDRWVEEIGLQIALQLPSPSAGHAYFLQLQSVRQALAEDKVSAVQPSMTRLIMMLGTKEGDISAETARWLLYVIGSVTPSQYLDQNAQSHLRLINEFYVVDQVPEVLREAGGNTSDHPGGGLYAWEFVHPISSWKYHWLWDGQVHPVLTLGLGVVLLIVVSAAALLYRVIRHREGKNRSTSLPRHAA